MLGGKISLPPSTDFWSLSIWGLTIKFLLPMSRKPTSHFLRQEPQFITSPLASWESRAASVALVPRGQAAPQARQTAPHSTPKTKLGPAGVQQDSPEVKQRACMGDPPPLPSVWGEIKQQISDLPELPCKLKSGISKFKILKRSSNKLRF